MPAWGERHLRTLCDVALPSVMASAQAAGIRPRLIVTTHKDVKSEVEQIVAQTDLDHRVCGTDMMEFFGTHRSLGFIHAHALRNSKPGDAICFVNADNVVSIECFAAAAARFAQGKRMILTTGHRTLSQAYPPIAAKARDLLNWVWVNRHPWISDCIWGVGQTATPSMLHFVTADSVVTHAFHLHPFAVINDGRDLTFSGATVDDDLPMRFKPTEIHVVTEPDEMAMGEMSPEGPAGKYPRQDRVIDVGDVARWARVLTKVKRPQVNDRHKFNFLHRIVIQGSGVDLSDVPICAEILAAIK